MIKLRCPVIVLFILSSLIIFYSCNEDSSETSIISQSDFKEKEADLHKLVKEEQYIRLDNSIPLRFVSKIVGAGDKLLIEDQDILYLYSKEGKFIRQIGSKGNGPEEYLRIADYCFDNESGKIFMLSPKNKLMVFNPEGEFIESFIPDEETSFNRIVFKDNMLYLFDTFSFGTLEYNWIIIDTKGKRLKVKYNYIPDYDSQMSVGYDPVFENEDLIYYWNNLNDTIYELNGMNSKAAFILAREEGRINTDDLKDLMSYSQLEKWQPYSIQASGDYL
ncbi:MAG TPA: 6-bladed beta-propeller, partial [Bacteroidales bacterium]|nr:6-bladed beta-propeller [Bacteroidales bacterium]